MPDRDTPQSLINSLAPLVDGLIVALAGWVAYFTRWQSWTMSLEYGAALILATGLALIILPASGAYRSGERATPLQHAAKPLLALVTVAVLLMLVGTLTKTTADFSRLWMAYWSVYVIAALLASRWLLVCIANTLPGRSRSIRVLIVGEGAFAQSVAQKLRDSGESGWEIVGIIAPFSKRSAPNNTMDANAGHDLESFIFESGNNIDEVWLAIEHSALDRQEAIIRVLQTSSLTVRYVPDLSILALLSHTPSEVAGMTVINLNATPLTGYNTLLKTIMDTVVAVFSLLLLMPLLLLIALCIKLDSPGPVFFKQQRHGWDGKIIGVLKFRTMRQEFSNAKNIQQASRDDPRITRVGRFLRRSSLDELPQFINVLRQEMSVVGPRPHPLALNKTYVGRINAYMQRHRVKPGITGWAQIHGFRGETKTLDQMQQRIDYDLYYIQHWSVWLDIRIIALTLIKGWTGSNAY